MSYNPHWEDNIKPDLIIALLVKDLIIFIFVFG